MPSDIGAKLPHNTAAQKAVKMGTNSVGIQPKISRSSFLDDNFFRALDGKIGHNLSYSVDMVNY